MRKLLGAIKIRIALAISLIILVVVALFSPTAVFEMLKGIKYAVKQERDRLCE